MSMADKCVENFDYISMLVVIKNDSRVTNTDDDDHKDTDVLYLLNWR